MREIGKNLPPAVLGPVSTPGFRLDACPPQILTCGEPALTLKMTKSSLLPAFHALSRWSLAFTLGLIVALFAGCATPTTLGEDDTKPEAQVMRTGDRIQVAFPSALNLNITQTINHDGKINLTLGGEIVAAGKTPVALEKDILDLIGTQLQTKDVKVTIVEAIYYVLVNGAVMKPEKIKPSHQLTVLEAIMEAGGFDNAKANTREVKVIRTLPTGQIKHFLIDVQALIDGKSTQTFYLRHGDIVIVPEKFTWF